MSPYAILWLEMHYLDQPMYSFTGKKLKVVCKMQGIETLFGFWGYTLMLGVVCILKPRKIITKNYDGTFREFGEICTEL